MQQQLGHYQIEEMLGEGAFAWVYRALDQKLERQVALKVLKPAWLNDPQALRRFEREAKTMARLHHPHIVQIYDVDEAEGQVYLAQFLVPGESLAARLSRGPLPWSETLQILRQVASALDYAHGQGTVHRDIKPTNILLEPGQHPYLSDFGLVKAAAEGSTSLSASSGGMIGTPAYMAPELWRGQEARPATDVYALSCVVVEMLTGRVLFDGPTPPAVMTRHVIDGPEFPAQWPTGVPTGVTDVLRRGLAADMAERIDAAGTLVTELEALTPAPESVVEKTIAPDASAQTRTEPPAAERVERKPGGKPPTVFVPTPERERKKVHPYVPEAQEQLRKGRISRRQFIYIATLLGCSVTSALAAAAGWSIWGGMGGQPAAPAGGEEAAGGEEQAAPAAGAVKRGGTFTRAMELHPIDHPARFWYSQADVVRQVGEYLTETGPDNITRPYLLESWEANEDVTEWTLNLRKGIKFNNGDELTADDVMFSFSEWLNPDVGSSILGLMSYLRGMQDVEKVDDYTIKLHLQSPNIGVPEHLFHYPAVILHRGFEGDYIRQPVGTGGFTLEEYTEGERAVLKRRDDYWRMGEDGQPLPYLDEIIYVSLEKDAAVAAMQAGQVDAMYQPRLSDWQVLKDLSDYEVNTASTAITSVLRMRVDLEPWSDNRVRQALKMCQDRERILQLAYFGQGDLGIDAHVAPVHPAYCEKPIPEYNPEKAKELLAEAGYPDGLQVTLATKNDLEEPDYAQALKEMAAPAGFDIELDITEPGGYWDRWTEVDLGITSWTHRPLDTMVLPLAYTADEQGNPVDWNETRWVDEEFSELLAQAERTLDVEERRAIMCKIEDIFWERGPIGIAYWKEVWDIVHKGFKNISAHPSGYDLLHEVWLDT